MLTATFSALSRLRARLSRGDLHLTLGRFKLVRQAYSLYQSKYQQLNADFHKRRLQPRESSFLPEISTKQCAQDLREDAIAFGLQLPPAEVCSILQFAKESPCYEPGFEGSWHADEVSGGLGARHVFRGLVQHPETCAAVDRVVKDPVLLEIVHQYLKYWPTKAVPHLTWSFVSNLPIEEQKRNYPPLNYHYDVAGYNFMTAYFHITDVDAQSGAHVMIEKSHNRKPFHTLLVPYSQLDSEEQLLSYYGQDKKRVIEGKAGFGYLQDPSCFHKLLPPTKSQRLLLQIRYA